MLKGSAVNELIHYSLLTNWHFSPKQWDYNFLKKFKDDLIRNEEPGKYRKKNWGQAQNQYENRLHQYRSYKFF